MVPAYPLKSGITHTARVVSAFRKHKNLREHLVKGRFGRYQEDVEHNLDLLLQAISNEG